jgi:4-hydroxy-3-methylbut-2-en-1-yl diphosphate synthase IspG/GcpE
MSTLTDHVRVSVIIDPLTRPAVKQHVLCSSAECGWRGTIAETHIDKTRVRRYHHIYICCPTCGGELIDLSTDEPRRWI